MTGPGERVAQPARQIAATSVGSSQPSGEVLLDLLSDFSSGIYHFLRPPESL